MSKREYAAVDLFKMACAILVMLIHTKPFQNVFWLDAGIGMITRFAVPYFFTTSGYFLFRQVKENQLEKSHIICKHLLRLVRFYSIWFVIFRICGVLLSGEKYGFWYNAKQFLFTTNGSPLWFVNALIWAIAIISVLSSRLRFKAIFGVSIIFLVIGYCLSTLYGVTSQYAVVQGIQPFVKFIGIQNGLFFAFPYVAMGAYLSELRLKKAIKKDIFFVVFFFICLGAESLIAVLKFDAPYTFLWLSALPMTYYTTKLTLTIELKDKPSYYYLRKTSTLFYVLHVLVFLTCRKLFQVEGLDRWDSMNLALTGLVLVITGLISFALVKLSNNNRFMWIKYIM